MIGDENSNRRESEPKSMLIPGAIDPTGKGIGIKWDDNAGLKLDSIAGNSKILIRWSPLWRSYSAMKSLIVNQPSHL